MATLKYILHALICYLRCQHKYGPPEWGMGPHGYYTKFRTCVYCEWIEMEY